MKEEIFRGIADPVRRAILDLLQMRPRPVEEIAGYFPVSRPAISKHLRVLREAGLVVEEKSGRQRFYALVAGELAPAREWLESLAGPGVPAGSTPASPPPPEQSSRHTAPPTRPRAAAPSGGRLERKADSPGEARGEDWRSW